MLPQKTQPQVPVPTLWLMTLCNSSPGGPDTLFWPLSIPSMPVVHGHTCQQDATTHKQTNEQTDKYTLSQSILRVYIYIYLPDSNYTKMKKTTKQKN